MVFLGAVASLTVVAWIYLVVGHGGYWRTTIRLPQVPTVDPAVWPEVVAIVPARDEAAILPETLPTLLGQRYPGSFRVVLVDDGSTDGTADVAAKIADAAAAYAANTRGDRIANAAAAKVSETVADTVADAERDPVADALGHPVADAERDPVADALGDPVADAAAAKISDAADPAGGAAELQVISAAPRPEGWAGKVWAMAEGTRAAGQPGYLLFTDADVAFVPGTLTALVRAAVGDRRDLLSQMAVLRARTGWERTLVPAFVYFFAQLYPFRRVNRGRTAAAAGGCMLVRRAALEAAGGMAGIHDALIDDVALARLLTRRVPGARCWLGLATGVESRRPYPRLADLWDMIARSAYTQLRYSPLLLAGTVAGMALLYALPPTALLAGLAGLASGAGLTGSGWASVAGAAGWALMTASYLPMLRYYRVSGVRAPTLPLIAMLYTAMTVDSARRHWQGRGGTWKGRAEAGRVST